MLEFFEQNGIVGWTLFICTLIALIGAIATLIILCKRLERTDDSKHELIDIANFLKNDVVNLLKNKEEIESNAENKSDEIEQLKNKHNAEIDVLKVSVAELKNQLEESDKQLKKKNEKLVSAEKELAEAEKKLEVVQKKFESAEKTGKTAQKKLEKAQEKAEKAENKGKSDFSKVEQEKYLDEMNKIEEKERRLRGEVDSVLEKLRLAQNADNPKKLQEVIHSAAIELTKALSKEDTGEEG